MKRIMLFLLSMLFLAGSCSATVPEQGVRLPVIMYHHILKSPRRWGQYIVSPATLEGDLQYLRDNGYTSVGVSDVLGWLDGTAEPPEKPVMLTFDDGQESFAAYAMPLFEKYNMKAVLSIVGLFADIYTEKPNHNINYSYMGWEQLGELCRTGRVELACHTYDMHSVKGRRRGCVRCSGEDVESYHRALNDDLEKVESRIAAAAGAPPTAFAFPFGTICDEARELLAQRGYRILLTCEEKVNLITEEAAQPLEFGRFNRDDRVDRERFFAKLR